MDSDLEPRISTRLRSRRLVSTESDKGVMKIPESVYDTPTKRTSIAGLARQNDLTTPSKSDTPRRVTRRNSITAESSPAIISTPSKRARGQNLAVIDEIKDVNSVKETGMIRNCYVLVKKNIIYNERGDAPDLLGLPKDDNYIKKIIKRTQNNKKKSPNYLVDDSNNSHLDNKVPKKRGRKPKNIIKNIENSDKNSSLESESSSLSKSSPVKDRNSSTVFENMKSEKPDQNISVQLISKDKSFIENQCNENSEKNDVSNSEPEAIENESDSKEKNDGESGNQSEELKVTFEEILIENKNPPIKYVKTPYLSKTKSILDNNISSINASLNELNEQANKSIEIENVNYSITERDDKENATVDQKTSNKITPFKDLSRDNSLPTSTPMNSIQLKIRSSSIDSKNNKTKKESNFSWSQCTIGKADKKLDIFEEKDKKKESPIKTVQKITSKRISVPINVSDDEETDEDQMKDKNEFIDDEALVGETDSIDDEERRDIEENEVPLDGISLGSEDTDDYASVQESENDSFIVSDQDLGLHSDSENEIMENSKKDKKYKRIKQFADSEEESIITKSILNHKNPVNRSNTSGVDMQINDSLKDDLKSDANKERHSIYVPDIPDKSPIRLQKNYLAEKANITIGNQADEENDPLNDSIVNKNDNTHFIDPNNATIFEQSNIEESDPLGVSLLNTTANIKDKETKNLNNSKKKIQLQTTSLLTTSPKSNVGRKSIEPNLAEKKSTNERLEENDLDEEIQLNLNTPTGSKSSKEKVSPQTTTKSIFNKIIYADVEKNYNELEDEDYNPQADCENTSGSEDSSVHSSLNNSETELIVNANNNEWETIMQTSDDGSTKSDKEIFEDLSKSFKLNKERVKQIARGFCDMAGMLKIDQNHCPELINKSHDNCKANQSINCELKNRMSATNDEVEKSERDKSINLTGMNQSNNRSNDSADNDKLDDEQKNRNNTEVEKSERNKSTNLINMSQINNQSNDSDDTDKSDDDDQKNRTITSNSEGDKIEKDKSTNLIDMSQNNNQSNDSADTDESDDENETQKSELSHHNKLKEAAEENSVVKSESKLTMQQILNRCDAILEQARLDKSESKSEFRKNKVLKKKNKIPSDMKGKSKNKTVSKNVEEIEKLEKISSVEMKPSTETRLQKQSKLLPRDILNAITADKQENGNLDSDKIKIAKKRKYSVEDSDENQLTKKKKKHNKAIKLVEDDLASDNVKGGKMVIDNDIKKSKKRKMSGEVPEESVTGQIVKYAGGEFYEKPVTPEPKKIKIISKIKTKAGTVIVEPLTPRKVQNGFTEAPLTPKPIGCKIQKILAIGEQEVPILLKSSKEKRSRNKINICEPNSTLPKPIWTKSGTFYEKRLSNNLLSTISIDMEGSCSTEFGICSLEPKSKKTNTRSDLNSNAVEFKAKSQKSENIVRESSKDLLRRKARQNICKKF